MFSMLHAALCLIVAAASGAHTVSYDSRSFILDGTRELLLSGSIHYQRVLPSDWPRVLALAAEAGFNTVQTYVAWDEHEPERGNVSFSGRNDIAAFVALAGGLGLRVTVRIGPYICGEHFNGGVPIWMRGPESGAACFRCRDPVWLNFTRHVLTTVVGVLEAANLLWTQGGPVVMMQVENEYGGSDVAYLRDCVDLARNATTSVPWILCHDLDLCTAVNKGSASPLGDAVCTINGFWEDGSSEGVQQPSPAFVAGQRVGNPNQPIAWTEDQGWFDQWGLGQRVRRTSDILYGYSRAVAYGLTHHNFYMLTGGSNFGYSAAEGVTTAYAADTAIDYLLLRHEPKFTTVAAFHAALTAIADALLGNAPAPPTRVGAHCEVARYGNVTIVSNLGAAANATEVVSVDGGALLLPNHTVVFLRNGSVLFNTSAAPDFNPSPPDGARSPSLRGAAALTWETIVERVGYGHDSAAPAAGAPPLEMLALTRNTLDYMYYTLTPTSAPLNVSELVVTTCGGEYAYLYSDGAAVPRAPLPRSAGTHPRTTHAFAVPPPQRGAAAQRLDILVSAMGLSTSPGPHSCKGVTRVVANGVSLTNDGWVSRWRFAGEEAQVYTPAGAVQAAWQPVAPSGGDVPTSWFKASLDLPALALPPPPPAPGAPPPQLAYALDLDGATKGVAWVNGMNIGRYNLELGVCPNGNQNGSCAPPQHGGQCYIWFRNCGEPTQRFYHVPTALLQPTGNLVVLFEETATVPIAGEGPIAPSPPPAAAAKPATGVRGGYADARWPTPSDELLMASSKTAAPSARDLSRIAMVALTQHP